MGLGVRLAAIPHIEDAKGSGKEKNVRGNHGLNVHFHSIYIWARVDNGTYIATVIS